MPYRIEAAPGLCGSLAALTSAVVLTSPTRLSAQAEGIELARMRPAGLLVDRYSYMAQPYSYHYFHHIDELDFRTDVVGRSGPVYPLVEPKQAFDVRYTTGEDTRTLADYFIRNEVTGFLVLHDDQIVVERYFHGATRQSRFVSQSVGKSILSILVGAAIEEGRIRQVTDPVVQYLPELASSGYRDATIKNVLQMATGVDYSENYRDSTSGAARIGAALVSGRPFFRDFVASMGPTSVRPGTKFEYQSVNTQLLGLIVEKVTGQRLADYAASRLWSQIGAEGDAFFYQARGQPDTCAFACFNATLRDYARVGLLMMRGGALGGKRVVSAEWVRQSTTPDAPYLEPSARDGRPGYGYQWWIPPGRPGVFQATGIYGQSIYVDPAKHLVIVQTSAWPQAEGSPALIAEFVALREAISARF